MTFFKKRKPKLQIYFNDLSLKLETKRDSHSLETNFLGSSFI